MGTVYIYSVRYHYTDMYFTLLFWSSTLITWMSLVERSLSTEAVLLALHCSRARLVATDVTVTPSRCHLLDLD